MLHIFPSCCVCMCIDVNIYCSIPIEVRNSCSQEGKSIIKSLKTNKKSVQSRQVTVINSGTLLLLLTPTAFQQIYEQKNGFGTEWQRKVKFHQVSIHTYIISYFCWSMSIWMRCSGSFSLINKLYNHSPLSKIWDSVPIIPVTIGII